MSSKFSSALFTGLLIVFCSASIAETNLKFAGAGYGEICSADTNCDALQYLHCPEPGQGNTRTCKCIGEENGESNYTRHGCLVNLDKSCSANPHCTYNAECMGPDTAKTCQCREEYVTEDGICKGKVGTFCGTDFDFGNTTECSFDQSLRCDKKTSTCQCYPGYEWTTRRFPNPDEFKCYPLIGTYCEDANECEPQARCSETEESTFSKCHCHLLSETRDHHCKIPYNFGCNITNFQPDPCNQDEMLYCNPETKKCDCDSNSTFYGDMNYEPFRSCRVKIGGFCDHADTENGPRFRICVPGADCIRKPDATGSLFVGICECANGIPSEDRATCSEGYRLNVSVGLTLFAVVVSLKLFNQN